MKRFLVEVVRWMRDINPLLSAGLVWGFMSFWYGIGYGLLAAAFDLDVYSEGRVHDFATSQVIVNGFFVFFPALIIGIFLHYRSKNILTNLILAGLLSVPLLLILDGASWLRSDPLIAIPGGLIAYALTGSLLLLGVRLVRLGYSAVVDDLN